MLRSAVLLLLVCASAAFGQGQSVALGDRVRIFAKRAGYDRITGTVAATTPDVISVTIGRLPTEVAVPRDSIDQLLLSIGSKRHPIAGAVVGSLVAAVGVFFLGPRSEVAPGSTIGTGKRSTKNFITGAVSGAAIGALIGHFAQTDTWLRVSARAR